MKVQFQTMHCPNFLLRQTPNRSGLWMQATFINDFTSKEAGWLVVYDTPRADFLTFVPKNRRIVFVTEPRAAKTYLPEYLNQFTFAISPHDLPGFTGVHIRRHAAIPWGLYRDESNPQWESESPDIKYLLSQAVFMKDIRHNITKKEFDLSVICSNHRQLEEHRQRIDFVTSLKGYFGERLHWYGKGFNNLDDKTKGILPYRYTIVLENTFQPDAWTEKPADAFLGFSYPFYSGPSNLGTYFNPDSFRRIDVRDVKGSIQLIEQTMASHEWERRLEAITDSRTRVLFDYNLFNEATRVMRNQPDTKALETPTLIRGNHA
jgi:hypothetical protein